jgi:hypothetical protein
MAKKPHRNITEYKKDVQNARIRRKIKEELNIQFHKENGEADMKNRQNLLMGHVGDGGDRSATVEDVMDSVVIEDDESKNVNFVVTDTVHNHVGCGLHHCDCTCIGDTSVDLGAQS